SVVKEDVAPETEKRAAQFLREVSEKLTEAAAWIEARNAGRNARSGEPPPAAQPPPSSCSRRRFEPFTGNIHLRFAQTRFPAATWWSESFTRASTSSLCALDSRCPLRQFSRLCIAQTDRRSPPAASRAAFRDARRHR